MWLGSSVVRVLARSERGPGFESRSGHVLFPLKQKENATTENEMICCMYVPLF